MWSCKVEAILSERCRQRQQPMLEPAGLAASICCAFQARQDMKLKRTRLGETLRPWPADRGAPQLCMAREDRRAAR
jgi:hypothetical protein